LPENARIEHGTGSKPLIWAFSMSSADADIDGYVSHFLSASSEHLFMATGGASPRAGPGPIVIALFRKQGLAFAYGRINVARQPKEQEEDFREVRQKIPPRCLVCCLIFGRETHTVRGIRQSLLHNQNGEVIDQGDGEFHRVQFQIIRMSAKEPSNDRSRASSSSHS
jgi:hypothetical protein